jgi:PleD family two-component response regulator
VSDVRILILDDDAESQLALRHILDSEGWQVKVVPLLSQGMAELASGDWTLVLANVALTDLESAAFETLQELAKADVAGPGRKRVRVLFLVPMLVAKLAQPALERDGLPYVLKPFHLHDLLQKVSDLLLEAQAIAHPIRRMMREAQKERRKKERRAARDRKQPVMFASRKDYQMTEEEIAEYERQEEEERKKRQQKEKELEKL